jgi:hypothetical protein
MSRAALAEPGRLGEEPPMDDRAVLIRPRRGSRTGSVVEDVSLPVAATTRAVCPFDAVRAFSGADTPCERAERWTSATELCRIVAVR